MDKNKARAAFIEAVKENTRQLDFMKEVMSKEDLYRIVFQYPKKWSRRKVKKRGNKDWDNAKVELGLEAGVRAVAALGPEYESKMQEVLYG